MSHVPFDWKTIQVERVPTTPEHREVVAAAIREGREQEPVQFLNEEAGIIWRRDWDGLILGFVLGVLATLAWLA